MRKKTGLAIILVALTLSLTTAALIPQNQTPSWLLTQTTTLKQPTPKSITITWGNETLAPNWTGNNQNIPSVCSFPDGSFVVAWGGRGSATTSDEIYAKVFDSSGVNTTGDILVNDYTIQTQGYPSVCCFSNGSFVVAWQCYRASGIPDIYARVFNSSGNPLTPDIKVNYNTTDSQQLPSVRGFPDGSGFVVVWQSLQTGDWDVYARVFNSSGIAQTGDILVNNYTTDYQWFPDVCCRSDGTFVVAWQGEGPEDDGVYAKVFDSTTGDNTTADFLVNTYKPGGQAMPSVRCFSDDSFVVAWFGSGQEDPGQSVYARVFDSLGTAQTVDIHVNTNITNSQQRPSVCCFSDGSFVVAWESNQAGDWDVYAKLFNSTGNNQTDDILVNTNTTNDQFNPSVCCLPNGSGFVVAWHSTQDDMGDIYFRIGHLPSPPGGAALLSLLLALLAAQSGAGVSVPLLVGGVLAVVVIVAAIAILLRRRLT